MRNRRNLIAILAILFVVLVGVITVCGVALITSGNNTKKYNEILASAEKYLESNDYDRAILEFNKAIELDDTNEEAYLQLALVYYNISELQNSYNTLRSCLLKIDSYRAQEFINAYLKEFSDNDLEEDGIKKISAEGKSEERVVMNHTFIHQMAEYSAAEYEAKYGTPFMKKDSDVYIYTYGNINAEFKYYNSAKEENIIDTDMNQPNSEAKPMEIKVGDLSLIFIGMGDTLSYEEIKANNLSNLEVKEKAGWDYCVTFTYSGCRFSIESSKDGAIKKDADNKIEPIAREAIASKFVLNGYVKDATTGEGVSEAKLSVREGVSGNGEVIEVLYTDAGGYYSVELSDGDYNVQIEKDGWTEERFEVHVNDYTETTKADFVINPVVAEGEIRIVLTWSASPSDLDSYLMGDLDDGTDVFVCFRDKTVYDANGNLAVELDVDHMDGYGPETVTIHNTNGKFKYVVHDYRGEGIMNYSEATVKVYMPGSDAPVEYTVIPDAENFWTVFEIDHGEITAINSPESYSESEGNK